MEHSSELEQVVREALAGLPWLAEKRMFGGIAWLSDGNMICAAIGPGLMLRVGKINEAEAQALPDVTPMKPGGRRMGGWVLAGEDAWRDDSVRHGLISMAVSFVLTLPSK